MNCQQCQRSLDDNFKVCPYCGTAVQQKLVCPSCQKQTDPSWVACPFCGVKLKNVAMPQFNQPFSQPVQPINTNQPNYPNQPMHGNSRYDSSNKHRKKRGFLGGLFSS